MTGALFLLTEGSAVAAALVIITLAAALTLFILFLPPLARWFDRDS